VSASGTAVSTAAGTVSINAARFTGGNTTLTIGGTLDLGPSGGLLNSTGNLTVTGGTLTTVSGGGNITVNAPNSTVIINSTIADNGGAVSLTLNEPNGAQSGNGLTGTNTFSGGLFIEGGRWQFGGANVGTGLITVLDGGEAFFNNGNYTNNIALEGNGASENDGSIRSQGGTFSGTITLLGDTKITQQNGSPVFTGQITGKGSIDFNDVNGFGSSIVLGNTSTTNPNNWNGNTVIDNPVVQNAANQIPSGANAGNVTVNQQLYLGGFNLALNGINGAGTIENTTASTTPQLSIGNNNQSFSFAGLLTDSSATASLTLVKSGTGIVALTDNSNAYHGGTIVNGGILQMGAANALGATTGALTVNGGGTLDLNNNSLTVGALSSASAGGVITSFNATGSALTLAETNANASTFAGSIQNGAASSIAFSKAGAGTLDLTGADAYSGATSVTAGALQIGAGGSILAASAVTLNGTASLVLGDGSGAVSQTLDSLTTLAATPVGGGASAASTLTLNNAASATFANAFGGAGTNQNNLNLVITGAGAVTTFSGTSTYTGTTQINGGSTFNLTGKLGNTAVTVNNGGVLTGKGDGTSTGLIGGTLTGLGGSTFTLNTTGTQLKSTGAIILGNTGTYNSTNFATLNYTLGGSNTTEALNTASSLTANNVFVNVTNPTQLGTFTLATYSSLTGFSSSGYDFSLSSTTANKLTYTVGRDTETLMVNAGTLVLTVSGVGAPNLAYFDGAVSKVWNDLSNPSLVNFSTNLAGTTDALNVPSVTTDVILNASNATTNQGNPLTETLGASTTINSLRVNGNGTTTIGNDNTTLTINAAADSYIVSDGTFTAGSQTAGVGIVVASAANSFTIQDAVALGGNQSWTNNSANLFAVNGAVSGQDKTTGSTLTLSNTAAGGTTVTGLIADGAGGSLALVVNNGGSGITTLSNTNTYSGGTTLNGGTLTSAASNGFGTGSVTVNPTNATGAAADNATLNSTGSVASTAVVTVNNETGDGGFGIGTINFNSAAATIGTLLGSGSAVLNGSSGTTLTIGSTNNLSGTFSGVISNGMGTGSLVKAGTGTENLTGANTYSGTTAVNAGTLALGSGGSIANTPSITLGSGTTGGTLQLGDANGVTNLTLTAATPITSSGSGTNSIVGGNSSVSTLAINSATAYALGTAAQPVILGGAGTNQNNLALNDIGTGIVTIGNGNQYSGGTSVSSGATLIDNSNSTGFGANAAASKVTIASGGTAMINVGGSNNYNYTFAGLGTAKFSFTSSGVGDTTTATTAFNGFTGTVEVANPSGGGNKLAINGDAGVTGATLLIDSGATVYVSGGTNNFEAISLNGTGNSEGLGAIRIQGATLGGNITLLGSSTIGDGGGTVTGNIASGAATGTQTLTFVNGASSNAVTLSGNISNGGTGGTVALMENHSGGVTTLSGTNTYTGATNITAGTLMAGSTGAFSPNSAVVLANTVGATLNTTGFSTTVGSLAGGGTTGGNVTLGAATLTTGGNNNTSASYAGVISGTGGLTLTGTGAQTLTGTNTYTGATTVTSGTLTLAAATTLPSTSGISVASGGTLSVTAASALNTPGATTSTTPGNPSSVSGQVPIMLSGGTLLRNGAGVSLGSQSGSIGTVGIGSLTLTAASTIDFGTTGVGTLNFNGLAGVSGTNALTIINYTTTEPAGSAGVDGTDDRIIFNQNVSSFLPDITLDGMTPSELALGNGEYELVTPVPEPATWAAGALAFAMLGSHLYRRCKRASSSSCLA
jgi:fibronectin-binding autotransporter adhesin